eukprot:1156183-Pelagomonas_calceolata.AAC.5
MVAPGRLTPGANKQQKLCSARTQRLRYATLKHLSCWSLYVSNLTIQAFHAGTTPASVSSHARRIGNLTIQAFYAAAVSVSIYSHACWHMTLLFASSLYAYVSYRGIGAMLHSSIQKRLKGKERRVQFQAAITLTLRSEGCLEKKKMNNVIP